MSVATPKAKKAQPKSDASGRKIATVKSVVHTLSAAELIPVLRWVNLARSRDETRPHLCAVHIEAEANLLRLVATDAYRIHAAEIEVADSPYNFKGYAAGEMQGTHVEALLRQFRGVKKLPPAMIAVEVGEKDAPVKKRQIATTYKQVTMSSYVDGEFPDWHQLMQDEWADVGSIDMTLAAQLGSSRLHQPVAIERYKRGYRICLSPSGDEAIGVNPKFLAEAVGGIKLDRGVIPIKTISPFRPILLEPAPGYSALVMTVRLGQ